MLWRALGHVHAGCYVDIGANDPIADSVSCTFHARGWRGVNVEPVPAFAQRLRDERPDDIVIEAAVAADADVVRIFAFDDTGLSTGLDDIAQRHLRESGLRGRELIAPATRLSTIFDLPQCRTVHWLKIDVEGMEADVLRTWGDHACRPWIVVIESTSPNSQVQTHAEWDLQLTGRGYQFVYFDGLNRYYVHKAHPQLAASFATPPNYFDHFELSETSPFVQNLRRDTLLAREDLAQREAAWRAEAEGFEARLADMVHANAERQAGWREARQALEDALRLQAQSFASDLKAIYAERDDVQMALQNAQRANEAGETRSRDQIARLEDMRREIEAVRLQLHQAHSDKASLQAWLEGERARLAAMKRSASWRVSAPLRWATTGARRAVKLGLKSAAAIIRAVPPLRRLTERALVNHPDLRNRIAAASRPQDVTPSAPAPIDGAQPAPEQAVPHRLSEPSGALLAFDALSRALRARTV